MNVSVSLPARQLPFCERGRHGRAGAERPKHPFRAKSHISFPPVREAFPYVTGCTLNCRPAPPLTKSDYVYETLWPAVRLTGVRECCPCGKAVALLSLANRRKRQILTLRISGEIVLIYTWVLHYRASSLLELDCCQIGTVWHFAMNCSRCAPACRLAGWLACRLAG
jgi:hypothetical protein